MRIHISLTAADLDAAKRFYSAFFAHEPTLERDGYLQWLLDEPRVNFVVEQGSGATGLSHLGVQAEDEAELAVQFDRVASTQAAVLDEGETQCCYARSTKNWTADPSGIRWENFLTHERTGDYGKPAPVAKAASVAAHGCC
ncbi:VOC family protein [Qipengyuania flava]|uniref:VOC family protein n=1 Tax=Qipengyuania flava TaxID=192812 RepID=UPI001C632DEE|nr:VOC family protein [Qipengyuania flava]QYJ06750.1 glyoxalase/bleomycin resistance/dioxygenase family protein [Qipengyuania flava]